MAMRRTFPWREIFSVIALALAGGCSGGGSGSSPNAAPEPPPPSAPSPPPPTVPDPPAPSPTPPPSAPTPSPPAPSPAPPPSAPVSGVITDVTFDWSSHQRLAQGSDNWPVTWSNDDHQYAVWGDGG